MMHYVLQETNNIINIMNNFLFIIYAVEYVNNCDIILISNLEYILIEYVNDIVQVYLQ